jgi:hypothetical protein
VICGLVSRLPCLQKPVQFVKRVRPHQ